MSEAYAARPTTLPPLEILEPISWQDQPVPERQWIVPGLIPKGNVTMLGGDGGVGKSLLALQLIAANALGGPDSPKKWLGREAMPCRAFGLFCEDDRDELHRRLADVAAYYGADLGDLENLQLCSRVGEDNALMQWQNWYEPGEVTALYGKILNHVTEFGAQVVVLDSLHDIFPGDEIKRTHARQFVQELRTIAIEIDGAVVLTAHPSLSGRNTGTGESGSTAWNNAVRSRLYLTRPEGGDQYERVLRTMKANYSANAADISLRWRGGVLLAQDDDAGMVGSIKRGNVDKRFLECLDAVLAEGRNVSDSRHSGNYAPKLFANRPEGGGIDRTAFVKAMERLFQAGAIRVERYGRKHDQRQRIVRADTDEHVSDKGLDRDPPDQQPQKEGIANEVPL